jgi:hypothetical protein
MDRFVATGILVSRHLGGDRAGAVACHRFPDNARLDARARSAQASGHGDDGSRYEAAFIGSLV